MNAQLKIGQSVLYQSAVGELIELTQHDTAVIRVNDVVLKAKRWELIPITPPEKILADTTLTSIDDTAWNTASDRAKAIRNVLEQPGNRTVNVQRLADDLNISERQAWRLVKQFEQHQTVSGLLIQPAGRKAGTTILDLRIERIISDRIEGFYLKPERPTQKSLCERVAADCREQGLKPPTDASVRQRLAHYEDRKSQGRRIGSKKAKYIYKAMPGHVDVSRPLQRVEIDHTPLDVMSISDDPHCDYIGRPWLTLAIDVYTRCVLGFLIGFEPPSILSVALCLTDVVRIKSPMTDYGVPLEWPMHGKPKEIVVDNGRDFVSVAFQRGCDEHDIVLTYRPIGSPQRLLRDANCRLLILDEVQDILLGTDREQARAIEGIKLLMNEVRIHVLAFGTERAGQGFRSDPHMEARFKEFVMPLWRPDQVLSNFLASYERLLPLRRPSHLGARENVNALSKAGNGILGAIVALVKNAALMAIADGSECITTELILRATERPSANLLRRRKADE